jgi:ornithine carbamoyltransferase
MRPSPIEADALAALAPHDLAMLLHCARMLQRAAQLGETRPLLRGRKLACLRDNDALDSTEASLVRRAAVELGAQVAQLRPRPWQHSELSEIQQAAGVLGRLYDAIDCQGMPADAVERLRVHAGVPVYDGLASDGHPTARIAELLDSTVPLDDRRRHVLQAVLLRTIV